MEQTMELHVRQITQPGESHVRISLWIVMVVLTCISPSFLEGQTIEWGGQCNAGDFANAYGIASDATAIYVCGQVSGSLPGNAAVGDFDGYLRKYSNDGTLLWSRQFGQPGAGGSSWM